MQWFVATLGIVRLFVTLWLEPHHHRMLARLSISPPFATLTLNDPQRRNAMSPAMFDALDDALAELAQHDDDIIILHLRGNGRAFCSGFDLAAAVDDPALMGSFIQRLGLLNRRLRRGSQIVIAAVQGAALAGGCALVSVCDFVMCAADAKLGYPVHRIGISPAVTLPTLVQAIGNGPARELVMSGRIIDGLEAHRIGLATHCVQDPTMLASTADALGERIATHGHHALRVTRQWINNLDGSLNNERLDGPMAGSAHAANDPEASRFLSAFWRARQR